MNPIKPAALAIALIGLSACSGSKKEQPKLDYQSENRKIVSLEVPPDLNNPNQGNLYQLPAGVGAVRASDFNRNNAAKQNAAGQTVLGSVKGVKMERDGSQRWLTVSGKQPAELWPLLKAFWQESGFTIASEEPSIGQMETDWAENRAKLAGGGLRSILEKIGLGGIYSTSERDKFIIRIEQGKNGSTDIFFAHKGMKEVYADRKKDTTMWQPSESDPNLEAAFLARFMQYLGVDGQQAEQALTQSVAARSNASELARVDNGTLLLAGDYGRNWRRTALALDRIGLTVIGQNAERRAFLVQQAPIEGEAVANKKPGLFKRVFGKGKAEAPKTYPEIIVYVEPINNGARLHLLNKDGSPYKGSDASTLLSRLHTELR